MRRAPAPWPSPRALLTRALAAGLLLACCASAATDRSGQVLARLDPRALAMFAPGAQVCYERTTQSFTSVVDAHVHFRPFGGPPIPFEQMLTILERAGVLFANVYGIGQSLPVTSPCEYYLDCLGTPARPSLKNDFANAQSLLDHRPRTVHLTLAMTFPDLAMPGDVLRQMALLDREYPGMFGWMGEVNLVKQGLFGNAHRATPLEAIRRWAPFMAELRRRGMPLAIHSDLGSDAQPTKYLPLMEEVVRRYSDNKIVWMHLGLSRELTTLDPQRHIAIVEGLLRRDKNLYVDISWRVIYDNYFRAAGSRAAYVAFLNRNSDRVLPGTDFVALWRKSAADYEEELRITSDILRDVDDRAFRNIALGQTYFDLLQLSYRAPEICQRHAAATERRDSRRR